MIRVARICALIALACVAWHLGTGQLLTWREAVVCILGFAGGALADEDDQR